MHQFGEVIPAFLKSAYGQREHDDYMEFFKKTKKNSKFVELVNIMTQWLNGRIAKRTQKTLTDLLSEMDKLSTKPE